MRGKNHKRKQKQCESLMAMEDARAARKREMLLDYLHDFNVVAAHADAVYFDAVSYSATVVEFKSNCDAKSQPLPSRGSFLTYASQEIYLGFKEVARVITDPEAAPRNCGLLLALLLTKAEQEPAIGDFLERYEQKSRLIAPASCRHLGVQRCASHRCTRA